MNELNNWKTNNAGEEIAYNSQNPIHVKGVCTMKETNNQQIQKAWLVVKDFEKPTKDEILEYSTTCSKENLWVVQRKWNLNSIDIKVAFLPGENIDRELYILPPKEAKTEKDI